VNITGLLVQVVKAASRPTTSMRICGRDVVSTACSKIGGMRNEHDVLMPRTHGWRFNDRVTPEQINIVETTIASIDLIDLTADFYRRAFEGDPTLAEMFTTDPIVQRSRFAAELDVIVRSLRAYDAFAATTRALGARHHEYGVRAGHFRLMGAALMGALAAALGERWNDDVAEAWKLAYNLTAETMMAGAMDHRD
jgi:nitric oxide dioxygenase